MKKFAACLATLLMGVAGCLTPASSPSSQSQSTSSQAAASTQENSVSNSDPASENSAVVYFSATGNTEAAAEYIAGLTGASTFVITPETPYTTEDLDYNDANSRVSKEHDDPSLQDVALTSTEVDGWDSVDVVYLGYPIWWGTSAWPVDSFVKAVSFEDKTIYPFATSFSSPIGSSGTDLATLANGGDWKEAIRFPSNVSEDKIREWLVSIGQLS